MYDFEFDENLDLKIDSETEEFSINETGETAILTGAFSDARVSDKAGYWLDIPLSNLWVFKQSRNNQLTRREIQESSIELSNRLVDDAIFNNIKTNVIGMGNTIIINFNCLTKSNKVILTKEIEV